MTQEERIQEIQSTHPVEWSLLYNKTFDELSEQQNIVCCCGKLATGLHEMRCRKFADKVRKETLKRWGQKLDEQALRVLEKSDGKIAAAIKKAGTL